MGKWNLAIRCTYNVQFCLFLLEETHEIQLQVLEMIYFSLKLNINTMESY